MTIFILLQIRCQIFILKPVSVNIRYVIWKLTSFVSVSIQRDIEIIKVQTVSKTKTRLISEAIA